MIKTKNGKIATNNKDNLEVVQEYLHKVYNENDHRERFAGAAKLIRKREQFRALENPILVTEFKQAISKLKNYKALGVM